MNNERICNNAVVNSSQLYTIETLDTSDGSDEYDMRNSPFFRDISIDKLPSSPIIHIPRPVAPRNRIFHGMNLSVMTANE